MDVMAAGNRRKAGSRSGQEDQLFMEYLIVPHVLYEGWRRQVGELRQVDRCALHASQRLCQHVVQIGGQLRQFAPKVFGNEPTTAIPGRHQEKKTCAKDKWQPTAVRNF